MPAEGVHFSALIDSACQTPHAEAAKLGAVFVDLPYFERFPLAVARYLIGSGPSPSRWGDISHHRAPIGVARGLIEAAAELSGESGHYLRGLALGYISHAAVDRSLHPFINQLAAERATRLGDSHARQHQEVEKFQSILFHQARLGFDVMGTATLAEHCTVDARPLWQAGEVATAVQRVLTGAWGESPSADDFRRWARGYGQYIALISSPLGRRVAPEKAKERERPALFPGFVERFERAVAQSRRWMQTLEAYTSDGTFDASARAQLEAAIPEGTIDPHLAA